jgi:hypothetical protein
MAKLIARLNRSSRNLLGPVGRPVVVGGAAALALGPGLTKASMMATGNPVVLDRWLLVGGVAVTVALVEGVMYFWGEDAEVEVNDVHKRMKDLAAKAAKDETFKKDLHAAAKKAAKDSGIPEEVFESILSGMASGNAQKKEQQAA